MIRIEDDWKRKERVEAGDDKEKEKEQQKSMSKVWKYIDREKMVKVRGEKREEKRRQKTDRRLKIGRAHV